MVDVLTSEQMRQLEQRAIESGQVRGIDLMERAGAGVVEAIFEHWPDLPGTGRAVVLSGPGNNGGDGFVVARLLHARGWKVVVFFYGDSARLPPDAKANHDRWSALEGAKTVPLSFPQVTQEEADAFAQTAYGASGTDLVIDALFGIGLTRPLDGLTPILELNDLYGVATPDLMPARHVSIDLPSGLAETGPVKKGRATVFHADLTVTFHSLKQAHGQGRAYCGHIVVKPIGL